MARVGCSRRRPLCVCPTSRVPSSGLGPVSEKALYFGDCVGTLPAMQRTRHHKPLMLPDAERRTLEEWARRPKPAQRLALRSRIVLGGADGLTNRAVAARLGASSNCVCKWRERFRLRRLEGLSDEPRPGAPRTVSDDRVVAVITRTLEAPAAEITQWSTRTLGAAVGLSEGDDRADLADVRPPSASRRNLQAVG